MSTSTALSRDQKIQLVDVCISSASVMTSTMPPWPIRYRLGMAHFRLERSLASAFVRQELRGQVLETFCKLFEFSVSDMQAELCLNYHDCTLKPIDQMEAEHRALVIDEMSVIQGHEQMTWATERYWDLLTCKVPIDPENLDRSSVAGMKELSGLQLRA